MAKNPRLVTLLEPWQRIALVAASVVLLGFAITGLYATENDIALATVFLCAALMLLFAIIGSVPVRLQAGGSGWELLLEGMASEDPVVKLSSADALLEVARSTPVPADVLAAAQVVKSDTGLIYEREVRSAISRVFPNFVPSRAARPGPDVVFRRINHSLAVEIVLAANAHVVAGYAGKAHAYGCEALLVVCREIGDSEREKGLRRARDVAPKLAVQIVIWQGPEDDGDLYSALSTLFL